MAQTPASSSLKARTLIRRYRAERLLTQEALAKKAKVSAITLAKVERGEEIGLLSQARLAKVLGLPIDELFPVLEPGFEAASKGGTL